MRTTQRLVVNDTPFYKDVTAWLVAALVGILAWLGRWTWTKLDTKADREELKDLMALMRERDSEAQESRRTIHQKLDATIAKTGTTAEAVARLEGRLHR